MGNGSKELVNELINVWGTKSHSASPAFIIKKLTDIYNVLEDTYSVSGVTEIQDAIDTIGAESGTIFIEAGTHSITTAIDIDGGGSLVIYGHGDNTILKPSDAISVFNATNCTSLTISNLMLDLSNYTGATQGIIFNEGSDRPITLDNVTITGGGTFGIGVELQSNSITIKNCRVTACQDGVYVNGSTGCNITGNTVDTNARYGIYLNSANKNVVSSNPSVSSNSTYGIYINNCDYCTVTGNTCSTNATGIYATLSDNNTFSSNTCNSNTINGIQFNECDYNTISSNTTNANDSNSASKTAGLYIGADCDYNTISANSSNNNNNIGAEDAYGIYISAANCTENTISANSATGNDVDYLDSGTDTTLVYYVNNAIDLQDAITSIGAKHGIVNLNAGTTTLTQAIAISLGGSVIVQGEGDNSIIDIGGDWKAFNITSAISVTLKNFKIDATDLTTATREIIDVTEATNYRVNISHVTIVGDGTNGYGIECNSQNVIISECDISLVKYGVVLASTGANVSNNKISLCATSGIYTTSNNNIISNNTITTSADGIYLSSANNNNINANNITACTLNGIYLTASTKNSITGNTCSSNASNTANPQAGIYLTAVSSNNTINSNNSTSNTNAGAGSGYGILVYTANCLQNTISGNTCTSNDINYLDNGTNSDILYTVTTAADLQAALDSIAAKAGTIRLGSGTIDLGGTTININGSGSYVIIGSGDISIIDIGGDVKAFNITAAESVKFQDFKIDAADLTTASKEIIDITEGSNNPVTMDGITIVGDGTNGYGIECNSTNCVIRNCYISLVSRGINVISNTNRIYNNTISSCAATPIYLSNADFNNIYDNTFSSSPNGVYLDTSDDNYFYGNTINANTLNGVYTTASDRNRFSNNNITANDSNTANAQGGVYIDADSDYNIITSNSITNNNNAGVGSSYGIYIANANCNNTIIRENVNTGNDATYLDLGTLTDIIYYCSIESDITDALTSIAAKSGNIKILGTTITLTGTITINGGGSYDIGGENNSSIIDIGGDWNAFNITSANNCRLHDFKIDAADLTTATKEIIDITEAANNPVTIENVTIVGDGTNGYGIEINSDNCLVNRCYISLVNFGIVSKHDHTTIINNIIFSTLNGGINCASNYSIISANYSYNSNSTGIVVSSATGSLICNNYCYNNNSFGIQLSISFKCTVTGNICHGNKLCGIDINASDNCAITGNNCFENNHADNNCYGILIRNDSNQNTVSGNVCTANVCAGGNTGYGIYINANTEHNNVIMSNSCLDNESNFVDNGVGTLKQTAAADSYNKIA